MQKEREHLPLAIVQVEISMRKWNQPKIERTKQQRYRTRKNCTHANIMRVGEKNVRKRAHFVCET